MGWTVVPTLDGRPSSELRPVSAERAKRPSLSAQFGLGKQPFHTDGAHLAQPPDVVILCSSDTNRTPTLVVPRTVVAHAPSDDVAGGVFLVDNGHESFLTIAQLGSGLRYDPGCMRPLDARARRLADYFSNPSLTCKTHHWDQEGMFLIIDNRHALHARDGVAPNDLGRKLARLSFRIGGSS